jgi:hypothetical protein
VPSWRASVASSQPNLAAALLDEGLGKDDGAAVVHDGDVVGLGVQDDGVVCGRVHGVVVQMATSSLPSQASRPSGTVVSSKRTKMAGETSSPYSISASASAVWQWEHQWTGLRPR